MQSDFKPVHLKNAKERLSKQLKAVETDTNINKEIFDKRSLWEKFLALFK